jgi:hypothetical protein
VIKSRFCASEKKANTLPRGCGSQSCDSKFRTRIKPSRSQLNRQFKVLGAPDPGRCFSTILPRVWPARDLIVSLHHLRHWKSLRDCYRKRKDRRDSGIRFKDGKFEKKPTLRFNHRGHAGRRGSSFRFRDFCDLCEEKISRVVPDALGVSVAIVPLSRMRMPTKKSWFSASCRNQQAGSLCSPENF